MSSSISYQYNFCQSYVSYIIPHPTLCRRSSSIVGCPFLQALFIKAHGKRHQFCIRQNWQKPGNLCRRGSPASGQYIQELLSLWINDFASRLSTCWFRAVTCGRRTSGAPDYRGRARLAQFPAHHAVGASDGTSSIGVNRRRGSPPKTLSSSSKSSGQNSWKTCNVNSLKYALNINSLKFFLSFLYFTTITITYP